MLGYLEYLNVPTKIAIVLVGVFLVLQIIGELLEFKGKIVPEFLKIRKYFSRKKQERQERIEMAEALKEVRQALDDIKEVKQVLGDVKEHYNADNIQKRDKWMQWVNGQAAVYDSSIVAISEKMDDIVRALESNTKMTEEMFVQSSRDRIIDFATKVGDENAMVSREEFNRIFKVDAKYEKFLEEHNLTNGEIDIAMHIIRESYEQHMKNHGFIEDVRGYSN